MNSEDDGKTSESGESPMKEFEQEKPE